VAAEPASGAAGFVARVPSQLHHHFVRQVSHFCMCCSCTSRCRLPRCSSSNKDRCWHVRGTITYTAPDSTTRTAESVSCRCVLCRFWLPFQECLPI
jgi:hypothetical protein